MIALELVPHEIDALKEEALQSIADFGHEIQWINIPDVLRVSVRAWEAARVLLQCGISAIPHLRTIDRSVTESVEVLRPLVELGLQKVVLISGDPPEDSDFVSSGVTPIELVKALKEAYPELQCYGALDPYRQSLRAELDYGLAKLEAGFDGLFTQPFFCPNLLEAYLKYFPGVDIWVGISPVTSSGSRNYWEKVNKVAFPSDFESGLDYAARQAKTLLNVAERYGCNSYLMPITIKAEKYLPEIFSKGRKNT